MLTSKIKIVDLKNRALRYWDFASQYTIQKNVAILLFNLL